MSGSSVQILAQAHAYIEAGNLEDAENLIRSLLEQDPDNTDAWWLLAHSVRDPNAAREALDEVLRRDPNDQQARSLLAALDDRFPSMERPGRGFRLPLRRPRLPSVSLRDFREWDYARPVSITALVILAVVGGWLVLRLLGPELVQTPAPPADTLAGTTQAAPPTAGVVVVTVTPVTDVAATDTPSSDATSPSATTEVTVDAGATPAGEGGVGTVEAVSAPAEEAPGAEAPEVAPADAAVSPAEEGAAPAGAGDGPSAGEEAPPESATAAPAGPALDLTPVPTYPFPLQTDAEDFQDRFIAAFAEVELELSSEVLLLEGTSLGSTALAVVCLDAESRLTDTVSAAMEVMAGLATGLRNSAPALGVRIVDCAQQDEVLRVIAAPLEDAIAWSEGSLEQDVFQSSWEPAG